MSIMNIYVFMGISIVRMQCMCEYNLFIYLVIKLVKIFFIFIYYFCILLNIFFFIYNLLCSAIKSFIYLLFKNICTRYKSPYGNSLVKKWEH